MIIITWLENMKMGLGAYLYKDLEGTIPVIGVAKTYYKDAVSYLEVYRGKSSKPLYISSAGIDLNHAAKLIQNLKGEYRIPEMLKLVDRLSREA